MVVPVPIRGKPVRIIANLLNLGRKGDSWPTPDRTLVEGVHIIWQSPIPHTGVFIAITTNPIVLSPILIILLFSIVTFYLTFVERVTFFLRRSLFLPFRLLWRSKVVFKIF